MESSKLFILLIFFSLLALSFSYSSSHPTKAMKHYNSCKNLVLCFHNIIYNDQTKTMPPQPSSLHRKEPTGLHFGNIAAFDDPITIDNNFRSKPVGRAQGFYIYNTKNTYTTWLGFSFVPNCTDYQGTINFAGADPLTVKSSDISMVGGTWDSSCTVGLPPS